MSAKVLKVFKTTTRRFNDIGADVTEADVADHALGFDGLKAAGFIGNDDVAFAPKPAAAAAPDPDEHA
jgi:hypothetical protein